MRGFTRAVYERMDLRSTGMEFASEFVIKAAQLGAKMAEIPITLWPDKRGRPPHLRSFRDGWRHLRFMLLYAPNWLFVLPGGVCAAGAVTGFLALAGAAHDYVADYAGRAHHDFWRDFHVAGGADTFDWRFRESVQLRGAIRSQRNSVAEARAETGDTGIGLLLGGVLFFAGLAGCAWVTWQWVASGLDHWRRFGKYCSGPCGCFWVCRLSLLRFS